MSFELNSHKEQLNAANARIAELLEQNKTLANREKFLNNCQWHSFRAGLTPLTHGRKWKNEEVAPIIAHWDRLAVCVSKDIMNIRLDPEQELCLLALRDAFIMVAWALADPERKKNKRLHQLYYKAKLDAWLCFDRALSEGWEDAVGPCQAHEKCLQVKRTEKGVLFRAHSRSMKLLS